MMNKIVVSGLLFAALSVPALAATTGFYVEQDAKTHACMVSDKKADGKTMIDVGTKMYASEANAQQAMANLKACAAPATPAAAPKATTAPATPTTPAAAPKAATPAAAGFYVEQDVKTHKCMVSDAKPDGKTMMDVGTKVYETKGRADQAMSMLKACKA
jgi:hypothetical protein